MPSGSLVLRASALGALAAAGLVDGASLKDIKHVVLFMQENRAFDHYFGTMAGVRGFGDPNVQVNPDGRSVFEQPLYLPRNGVKVLKPWHINHLGGEWVNASQCMGAGDNGWAAMHSAYAGGLGNNWNYADGGYSMGYYKREDVPAHFDIAEGWTLLDMSTQSILAATDPNRIQWMSGTINVPGSPTNPEGKGSVIIDNSASPGCEAPGLNCFPFLWKTFPEYLEEAGISWQVWQDLDNFEDNMLAYFEQYQLAAKDSPLRTKGNSYPGFAAFYESAAKGTLPQVSWIVGPQELAEHPPNRPVDGAWFQKKVIDAITSSPAYNETVLIISYDEQGGWADHVVPQPAAMDTPGEWMEDPYNELGCVPVGPGWRIPRYIISPYTRGGNVFTERADHSSDILFLEAWAAAHGYEGVRSKELTQWRRDHMSNLVNALDFRNPDYSLPSIHQAPTPESLPDEPSRYTGNLTLGSLTGPWVGPARCLSDYKMAQPPIPYGPDNANQDMAALVEEGFKPVRGQLTEGRYLTFETRGHALSNRNGQWVDITPATDKHERMEHRWIIHAVDGSPETFHVQSAQDKKYIAGFPVVGNLTTDVAQAQAFTISYNPPDGMYSIKVGSKQHSFVSVKSQNRIANSYSPVQWGAGLGWFQVFSVSYHT
ncbi:Phosphoesterase [Drechmeria coniospora]|uniref:Phosphoesterase n=1 Tax=Drechmeria coniospora TaxID=98403 RepID=A0A151GYF5_DRECN|nr:Phosphoesterase [Drechmeria coniospora]KYK62120.1 Phosphoesterase [Drechmeria coniospora]